MLKTILDDPVHLEKAPQKERGNFSCPKGHSRRIIDPEKDCNHRFQLKQMSENENAPIKLFKQDNEQYFDESKFCIDWDNDHFIAEVCIKDDEKKEAQKQE